MFVDLTRDECYTEINTFYKIVARKMGFENVNKLKFDCREIIVTTAIKDIIADFYYKERGANIGDFSFIWACFGPKASLAPGDSKDQYRIEVDERFIIQEEY